MMSLDTLRIARELRDADVAPAQAEAIAAAVGDAAANKSDIEVLTAKLASIEAKIVSRFDAFESKFTAENESLEQRLVAKIETMRSSILVWLIGIVIAASGLLVTIGKVYYS